MSYLRGPLAREQIRKLSADTRATPSVSQAAVVGGASAAAGAMGATTGASVGSPSATERPILCAEIEELFLGEPVGEFAYHPAHQAQQDGYS